jgi:membrane-bound metal-dependent hydrolase YbcI (DUF457 family)
MFIGHYGVAFGAKRVAPRTSLGTLAFAAQFLDELWPILLLLGVERAHIVPGLMAANPISFDSYPFSHSLATATLWSILIGAIYFALQRNARGGWVVGVAVLSHWLLDVPMHRPDLPLWPGGLTRVGLGAWNSVPLTVVLDYGVFAVGLALYMSGTRAADRIGRWGIWALVALLVTIALGSTFGPPPANEHALALNCLGLWLIVPLGWWVDRHRVVVANEALAVASSPLQMNGA